MDPLGAGARRRQHVVCDADDRAILDAIAQASKAGIDCPLGWPMDFVAFVAAHQAGEVATPTAKARKANWGISAIETGNFQDRRHRGFTERWVHQQHIRDAVRVPGGHDRFLPVVLGTFVLAFPYQCRPEAVPGTSVQLDFGRIGGSWTLTREASRWVLDEGAVRGPAATLRMAPQAAWRQLTGLPVRAGHYTAEGDDRLVRPLLAVRSIIV